VPPVKSWVTPCRLKKVPLARGGDLKVGKDRVYAGGKRVVFCTKQNTAPAKKGKKKKGREYAFGRKREYRKRREEVQGGVSFGEKRGEVSVFGGGRPALYD